MFGTRQLYWHSNDPNAPQSALGAVSFTADIWSDDNLRPFLAITAHWIQRLPGGLLVLRADLVAFSYIPSSHSGPNIAKAALAALERADLLNQVHLNTLLNSCSLNLFVQIGWWTLDNASNNNTFMSTLAKMLKDRGITFNHFDRRIRYVRSVSLRLSI